MINAGFPENLSRNYWVDRQDADGQGLPDETLAFLAEIEKAHRELVGFGPLPSSFTDFEKFLHWHNIDRNHLDPLIVLLECKTIYNLDDSVPWKKLQSNFEKYCHMMRTLHNRWVDICCETLSIMVDHERLLRGASPDCREFLGFLMRCPRMVSHTDFQHFLASFHAYSLVATNIFAPENRFFRKRHRLVFGTTTAEPWLRPFSALSSLNLRNYRNAVQTQTRRAQGEGYSMTDEKTMGQIIGKYRSSVSLVRSFIDRIQMMISIFEKFA